MIILVAATVGVLSSGMGGGKDEAQPVFDEMALYSLNVSPYPSGVDFGQIYPLTDSQKAINYASICTSNTANYFPIENVLVTVTDERFTIYVKIPGASLTAVQTVDGDISDRYWNEIKDDILEFSDDVSIRMIASDCDYEQVVVLVNDLNEENTLLVEHAGKFYLDVVAMDNEENV